MPGEAVSSRPNPTVGQSNLVKGASIFAGAIAVTLLALSIISLVNQGGVNLMLPASYGLIPLGLGVVGLAVLGVIRYRSKTPQTLAQFSINALIGFLAMTAIAYGAASSLSSANVFNPLLDQTTALIAGGASFAVVGALIGFAVYSIKKQEAARKAAADARSVSPLPNGGPNLLGTTPAGSSGATPGSANRQLSAHSVEGVGGSGGTAPAQFEEDVGGAGGDGDEHSSTGRLASGGSGNAQRHILHRGSALGSADGAGEVDVSEAGVGASGGRSRLKPFGAATHAAASQLGAGGLPVPPPGSSVSAAGASAPNPLAALLGTGAGASAVPSALSAGSVTGQPVPVPVPVSTGAAIAGARDPAAIASTATTGVTDEFLLGLLSNMPLTSGRDTLKGSLAAQIESYTRVSQAIAQDRAEALVTRFLASKAGASAGPQTQATAASGGGPAVAPPVAPPAASLARAPGSGAGGVGVAARAVSTRTGLGAVVQPAAAPAPAALPQTVSQPAAPFVPPPVAAPAAPAASSAAPAGGGGGKEGASSVGTGADNVVLISRGPADPLATTLLAGAAPVVEASAANTGDADEVAP